MEETLEATTKNPRNVWAKSDRGFVLIDVLAREKTKLHKGVPEFGTAQKRGLEENETIIRKENVW